MHHVAESSAEENRGTIIATLGHAHETKHLQKIEDTYGYTIHWLSNVNHWIGLRENLREIPICQIFHGKKAW